jgi:hypothetical protein
MRYNYTFQYQLIVGDIMHQVKVVESPPFKVADPFKKSVYQEKLVIPGCRKPSAYCILK